LPRHLPEKVVLAAIAPDKDVGGVHPLNAGKLFGESGGYLPYKADACLQALAFTKQPLQGKTAVLLGAGDAVGKPLALLLLQKGATVTLCPTLNGDLPEICRGADILVTEARKPGLVRGDWIKPGAVVIDVGINRLDQGLVGDVDFESAKAVAGSITPVPGGVGPMTITMLLKNTLVAAQKC